MLVYYRPKRKLLCDKQIQEVVHSSEIKDTSDLHIYDRCNILLRVDVLDQATPKETRMKQSECMYIKQSFFSSLQEYHQFWKHRRHYQPLFLHREVLVKHCFALIASCLTLEEKKKYFSANFKAGKTC